MNDLEVIKVGDNTWNDYEEEKDKHKFVSVYSKPKLLNIDLTSGYTA